MREDRDLGERGLSGAMDRLRSRLDDGDWYQVPLTEALFWITALKDLHGNGIDYATTEGKTLQALGWARNYAAHELLTLSGLDLGSSALRGAAIRGQMVRGAGGRVVWIDETALPQRQDERGRRTLYQSLVANRGPLEPLAIVETFLKGLP